MFSHVWSSSSYCQFNHLEHHKYLRIRSISPPLRIRYLWIRSLKAPHYLHVFHHVFFSPLTSHPILCNWMRFFGSSVMAAFSFSSLTCNAGIAWPRVRGDPRGTLQFIGHWRNVLHFLPLSFSHGSFGVIPNFAVLQSTST